MSGVHIKNNYTKFLEQCLSTSERSKDSQSRELDKKIHNLETEVNGKRNTVNKRYCWQAVKEITVDNGAIDGVIVKEHIKKYGGHFGKPAMEDEIGKGFKLKSQVEIILKNDSLAGSEGPTKDKFEDFDNLNKKFSVRIIEINDKSKDQECEDG
ncbi:hypothetical protein RhiirC2_783703 [Rhizophagus irregularis]|uniref:Uncharacterized protein n=1 Tax=Rhizophagus irregularis TaxID=588596 RepID=A0A2N1N065_9GLOM|nr:hypothetical protein RhiirC2_783703 [Rhizophagus irregularis]